MLWEPIIAAEDPTSERPCAARKSHSAAAIGSDVWVYGGMTAGGISDELVVLSQLNDPAECAAPRWQWSRPNTSGNAPPALCLHMAAAYGWAMLIFGGLREKVGPDEEPPADGTRPPRVPTNELWVLDTQQEPPRWSRPQTVGEPPSARVGHCATVGRCGDADDATLFVYGGFNPELATGGDPASGYLNDLSLLSLPGHSWSHPIISLLDCCPPSCTSASLSAIGGGERLILLGGARSKQATGAALMIDANAMSMCPLADTDEAGGASPAYRCNHTAVQIGDALVVYGGATGEWEYDDVAQLLLPALQWELKADEDADGTRGCDAPLPLPRQRHAAVEFGGAMLVIGGSCGERLLDEEFAS